MLISLSIHLLILAILSLSRAQQDVVTTDANGNPITVQVVVTTDANGDPLTTTLPVGAGAGAGGNVVVTTTFTYTTTDDNGNPTRTKTVFLETNGVLPPDVQALTAALATAQVPAAATNTAKSTNPFAVTMTTTDANGDPVKTAYTFTPSVLTTGTPGAVSSGAIQSSAVATAGQQSTASYVTVQGFVAVIAITIATCGWHLV